jgi:hypothetical protein
VPNANWFPRSRIAKGDAGRPNLHAGVAGYDRDQFSATDCGWGIERFKADRLATADGAAYGLADDLVELGGATVTEAGNPPRHDFKICGRYRLTRA